jgi:hypothetical protein
LKEVENLLGGPPGDYGPGKAVIIYEGDLEPIPGCDARVNGTEWIGEHIGIGVCFDKQGRISQIARLPVLRQESLLVTILRKVGLKK